MAKLNSSTSSFSVREEVWVEMEGRGSHVRGQQPNESVKLKVEVGS